MNKLHKITAVVLLLLSALLTFGACTPKSTTSLSQSPSSEQESASKGDAVSQNPSQESSPKEESSVLPEESLDDSVLSSQDDEPEVLTFSLNNVFGQASREVTLELSIENNPGIAGYSVTICYDPQVMALISHQNNVPGGFDVINDKTSGKVRVMCTVQGGNALDLNGVCDTLTFKLQSEATLGTHDIDLVLADAADSVYTIQNGECLNVECILVGSTLTVHC